MRSKYDPVLLVLNEKRPCASDKVPPTSVVSLPIRYNCAVALIKGSLVSASITRPVSDGVWADKLRTPR